MYGKSTHVDLNKRSQDYVSVHDVEHLNEKVVEDMLSAANDDEIKRS